MEEYHLIIVIGIIIGIVIDLIVINVIGDDDE